MNIKTVLLCALAVLCTYASLAWSGPIYKTEPIKPSDLNTPLANPGKTSLYTYTGCVSVYTGIFIDCGYDFSITRLKQPEADPANNGGHTHTYANHPLGTLTVIWPPSSGNPSTSFKGQTQNSYVYFSHEIPPVSGKIETVLNLRVPQGWYTVNPESCDASNRSWCFNTTVDVGVKNLTSLPDTPSLYLKSRAPDVNHTDAVAFYGTDSAIGNIYKIAGWYNWLTEKRFKLSINDMSLIKGGLFDINGDYSAPHRSHRTGESADINKDVLNGVKLDCTKNKLLSAAVFLVIRPEAGTIFSGRVAPSWGHFLCETGARFGYSNNIHIDL